MIRFITFRSNSAPTDEHTQGNFRVNEKVLRMRVAKKCFSIYQLPTHQILASFFEKLTACLRKERQSYEDFIILNDFHIDVKVAGRESPNGIAV